MQPVFFWLCISTNVLFLFIKGPKVMRIKPVWLAVIFAAVIGAVVTLIAFVIKSRMPAKEEKQQLREELKEMTAGEKKSPATTPGVVAPEAVEIGVKALRDLEAQEETNDTDNHECGGRQRTESPSDGGNSFEGENSATDHEDPALPSEKDAATSIMEERKQQQMAISPKQKEAPCPHCKQPPSVTPYCRQTGKPHLTMDTICPVCKEFLGSSPFCAMTGLRHLPAAKKTLEETSPQQPESKAESPSGSPVPKNVSRRVSGSFEWREGEYAVNPISKRSKYANDKRLSNLMSKGKELEPPAWMADEKGKHVEAPFVPLLIVSALSVAFAHGGNDVGNAVGPLSTILGIHETGEVKDVPDIPYWALFVGAAGFIIGIITMGSLTIKTVGTKITTLTPSKSFATQIGAAVAVLGSSALKLPVSTSHCLVGAVLGIGLVQWFLGTGEVNARVLSRIVLAWVVTIPIAMICTLVVYWPFAHLYMN
jgi:phosphate/sulfate permease